MWKIYFRKNDENGKLIFEGCLTKEYRTKPNAAKLAKKFAEAYPDMTVEIGQSNPFAE